MKRTLIPIISILMVAVSISLARKEPVRRSQGWFPIYPWRFRWQVLAPLAPSLQYLPICWILLEQALVVTYTANGTVAFEGFGQKLSLWWTSAMVVKHLNPYPWADVWRGAISPSFLVFLNSEIDKRTNSRIMYARNRFIILCPSFLSTALLFSRGETAQRDSVLLQAKPSFV